MLKFSANVKGTRESERRGEVKVVVGGGGAWRGGGGGVVTLAMIYAIATRAHAHARDSVYKASIVQLKGKGDHGGD